jgi:hypothetical protein
MLNFVRGWGYYDNMQHMKFVNENDENYGPIIVYNASVRMYLYEGKEWREVDRWGDAPIIGRKPEALFHGDLSPRRIKALMIIAKEHHLKVMIYFEHRDLAFEFSNEPEGNPVFTGDERMISFLQRFYPTIVEDLMKEG